MVVRKYPAVRDLLKAELPTEEFPKARSLIDELCVVKKRGYFTGDEFLAMCEWKSHRPRRYFQANDDTAIKRLSTEVFATTDERQRIDRLNSLKGVGIPMASAILMLTGPEHYGVIDYRVWQVLYEYGEVRQNPSGRNLSANNWLKYLRMIRGFAKEFRVMPRDIDRTLFLHDRPAGHGRHY